MQNGSTAAETELRDARALREWVTGEQKDFSRVFFVETNAEIDGLLPLLGADDVLLLPADSETYRGPARAVRCSGAFSKIGDELFIGDRSIELQDYVAAEFIQMVGPTAACISDAAGWCAFVDDAEVARRTGVFPTALLDPRVLLVNRGALADPLGVAGPTAFSIGQHGRVTIGVHGECIGRVGDPGLMLTSPRPRHEALGSAVRQAMSVDGYTCRPWTGRYLNATDLMKMLRLTNGAARISGFGWTLLDDGGADAEPMNDDPFLVEMPEGVVLADTITLRRQLLSPVTAVVVAATQTSSTPEVAGERVARRCDMDVGYATRLCRDAVAALGVHPGARSVTSPWTTGSTR
nr:daptide biosynthesis RiPP recognition protein [Microbacterium hydrocarbonoxydans]